MGYVYVYLIICFYFLIGLAAKQLNHNFKKMNTVLVGFISSTIIFMITLFWVVLIEGINYKWILLSTIILMIVSSLIIIYINKQKLRFESNFFIQTLSIIIVSSIVNIILGQNKFFDKIIMSEMQDGVNFISIKHSTGELSDIFETVYNSFYRQTFSFFQLMTFSSMERLGMIFKFVLIIVLMGCFNYCRHAISKYYWPITLFFIILAQFIMFMFSDKIDYALHLLTIPVFIIMIEVISGKFNFHIILFVSSLFLLFNLYIGLVLMTLIILNILRKKEYDEKTLLFCCAIIALATTMIVSFSYFIDTNNYYRRISLIIFINISSISAYIFLKKFKNQNLILFQVSIFLVCLPITFILFMKGLNVNHILNIFYLNASSPENTKYISSTLITIPIFFIFIILKGTIDLNDYQDVKFDEKKFYKKYSYVKKAQKKLVKSYRGFSKITEKYNIKLVAIYGTALGIYRHKNKIIPWDDDIDLAVDYKDYTNLIKNKNEFSKHGFEIVEPSSSFSRVTMTKVFDIQNKTFIDIFLYTKKVRLVRLKITSFLIYILSLQLFKTKHFGFRYVFNHLINPLWIIFPRKLIWKYHLKLHKLNTTAKTDKYFVSEFISVIWNLWIFDTNDIGKLKKTHFHGSPIYIYQNMEKYLLTCYSNLNIPRIFKPIHQSDFDFLQKEKP